MQAYTDAVSVFRALDDGVSSAPFLSMLTAFIIFTLSYLVIAGAKAPGLRLERASAAFAGAVAMVALGTLAPEAAMNGISGETLLLLVGMMLVTEHLSEAAVFRHLSWLALGRFRRPRTLLVAVTFIAGGLSAFLVNDAVCLMLAPLVVQMARDARLRPLPFLLALAFGSNAGSAATLTGNPQNMIIGTLSNVGYARFAAWLALPALASVLVVALVLLVVFRTDLPNATLEDLQLPRPPLDRTNALVGAIAVVGLLVAFFAGGNLAWSALGAGAFLLIVGRRTRMEPFRTLDWSLIVFFAALFVLVRGAAEAGLAERLFEPFRPWLGRSVASESLVFGFFTLVASQLVSNVPFVVLAAEWMGEFLDTEFMWLSTALFATLAGNLTPIASVANVIVLDGAREEGRVPFLAFLRVGAPVTLLTLAAGWSILLLERRFGWF